MEWLHHITEHLMAVETSFETLFRKDVILDMQDAS